MYPLVYYDSIGAKYYVIKSAGGYDVTDDIHNS